MQEEIFIASISQLERLQSWSFVTRDPLNIECDGDFYHINKDKAVKDNRRDNYLTKKGWSILRYSTSQIEDLNTCVAEINETIRQRGGLESRISAIFLFLGNLT
jgi:very-short-patch-repair endonuclease